MAEEMWRTHPVWDDHQASSEGRIRRLEYRDGARVPGYMPACNPDRGGRLGFMATDADGKRHRLMVHKFVCETFHGLKPSPELQCRHLNGDHLDNRAVNLQWGTSAQNGLDRTKHATHFHVGYKVQAGDWRGHSPSTTYVGPKGIFERFMAGETLTMADAMADDSEWGTFPMSIEDRERLQEMLRPTIGEGYNVREVSVYARRTRRSGRLKRSA